MKRRQDPKSLWPSTSEKIQLPNINASPQITLLSPPSLTTSTTEEMPQLTIKEKKDDIKVENNQIIIKIDSKLIFWTLCVLGFALIICSFALIFATLHNLKTLNILLNDSIRKR